MISLPHEVSDFKNNIYWSEFFNNLGDREFEWYIDYEDCSEILKQFICLNDRVLIVGCGNSDLSFALYRDKICQDITNIDIVSAVIDKCLEKAKLSGYDGMKFLSMDVLKMNFPIDCFDVVCDKGTLDALAHDSSEETYKMLAQMWTQICKVLSPCKENLTSNGVYIVITLAQNHILELIGTYFFGNSVNGLNKNTDSKYVKNLKVFCLNKEKEIFPIFIFVFQLGQHILTSNLQPTLKTIFEAFDVYAQQKNLTQHNENFLDSLPLCKFDNYNQLINWVNYKQSTYTMMKKEEFEKMSKLVADKELKFDLFSHESDKFPRYTFYLVKCPDENVIDDGAHKFAAFIVPLAKEGEWLFNTPKGRQTLVKTTGFKRLIIIHMNRNHTYTNLEAVQAELSPTINEYRSDDLAKDEKIPFLSIGSDALERVILERGPTADVEENGEYQVEDVKLASGNDPYNGWYRRLYLLNTPSIIQTEISLVKGSDISKDQYDPSFMEPDIGAPLESEHYRAMITAVALKYLENESTNPNSTLRVLIIGLGGGLLPNFMYNYLFPMKIHVCEIDEQIAKIAQKYFGFPSTNTLLDPSKVLNNKKVASTMALHIIDGLEYLREHSNEKFNVIILDANTMEASDGLISPPGNFLYPQNMRTLVEGLEDDGLLLSTLLTRDTDEQLRVEECLKAFFPSSIYTAREIDLGEDVLNKVLHVEPKVKLLESTSGKSKSLETKYISVCNELSSRLKNTKFKVDFDPSNYLIPLEQLTDARVIY